MSDLARHAAAKIERRYIGGGDDDPLVIAERKLLAEMIEADGVLVSHEDAALLREVKRALARVDILTIELMRNGEFCVEVLSDHGLRRAIETGVDATAALKSALDAAGVPDEKGT